MQTYSAMPPIVLEQPKQHPLKAVFITVLTLKLVVGAILVGTVSLAPPVAADTSYMVGTGD